MTKLDVMEEIAEEEDTQKDQYLTFTVKDEAYGIEIRYVTEIINLQTITRVPGLAEYIRGIINVRGKIIPVMDVRSRFRQEPGEYSERTCVVVVDMDGLTVGLIVDSVAEVVSIPDEDIVPPPDYSNNANRFIKAIGRVGDAVKLILDCGRLLSGEDEEILTRLEQPV